VGAVAGEPPVTVPDPLERPPAHGGLLQYVSRAGSLADLDTDRACSAHHRAGDAYLLRSDTTAHRVTSLTRPGVRRTVLNFAYTTRSAAPHSTQSARELYV
jgi:hypothetical protein